MTRLSPFAIELASRRDPIVAGNHSRHDPGIQAQNEPPWVTPSTVEEQYGVVGPDSPRSTTSSSQDRGSDSHQGLSVVVFYGDRNHAGADERPLKLLPRSGGLPRDRLGMGRSKTGSIKAAPEIHFECRICLSNPTLASNLTATHCGHLFCYE